MEKDPPASAGDAKVVGSIPGWGRFPVEGNGNSLQYSCLENCVNRGACGLSSMGSQRDMTEQLTLSLLLVML